MASLKCSNCGLVNFATDANCKRCGTPLAHGPEPPGTPTSNVAPQYGSSGQTGYPPPDAYYPQTPASAASQAGDYVFPPPPSVGLYPQGGVWQDKSTLVMSKEAALPDRCVKCNSPANGLRLKRNLYWHNPIYYLLIFGGVLLYLIVALIVRKSATVNIPLCEAHLARRRHMLIAGWLVFLLLGIGGFIVAIAGNEPTLALLGVLGFFAGLILLIIAARTVIPTRIDDRFVWLKGINSDYLNGLPQWPGQMQG
jgi:hypothetical protein